MGIKQVSIGNKIIGGFLVVALSLAVGTAVGIWSLMFGVHAQEEAAVIRLRGQRSLEDQGGADRDHEVGAVAPHPLVDSAGRTRPSEKTDIGRVEESIRRDEGVRVPSPLEGGDGPVGSRPSILGGMEEGHEKVLSLLDAGGPNRGKHTRHGP